jgi:hypothetical protein
LKRLKGEQSQSILFYASLLLATIALVKGLMIAPPFEYAGDELR